MQVQHPGLRDSFAADAATVEALVKIFTWLFPGFEYSWLVDEVKHGLPKVAVSPFCVSSQAGKRESLNGSQLSQSSAAVFEARLRSACAHGQAGGLQARGSASASTADMPVHCCSICQEGIHEGPWLPPPCLPQSC